MPTALCTTTTLTFLVLLNHDSPKRAGSPNPTRSAGGCRCLNTLSGRERATSSYWTLYWKEMVPCASAFTRGLKPNGSSTTSVQSVSTSGTSNLGGGGWVVEGAQHSECLPQGCGEGLVGVEPPCPPSKAFLTRQPCCTGSEFGSLEARWVQIPDESERGPKKMSRPFFWPNNLHLVVFHRKEALSEEERRVLDRKKLKVVKKSQKSWLCSVFF